MGSPSIAVPYRAGWVGIIGKNMYEIVEVKLTSGLTLKKAIPAKDLG